MISFYCCSYVWINSFTVGKFWQHCHISAHISLLVVCPSNNYFRNFYHQSTFPFIIIIIIIIPLFFHYSIMFRVNLFVSFLRCFVMLNSHDVCFIIYIYIIIYYTLLYIILHIYFISKKIVHIIFVPKIGVCFSFYPVSLIFEYEAKPHIRWPHIREYEAGESGANFTLVENRSLSSNGLRVIFTPNLEIHWFVTRLDKCVARTHCEGD